MKFARLLALVALMFMAMIVLTFALSGCNPLKPYKQVQTDSIGRNAAKIDILSHTCFQAFPMKVKEGKTITDTQYVANPFEGSQCDEVIKQLEAAIVANRIRKDSINIDSLKSELLSHLKSPIIDHYKTDTVPDLAAIQAATSDRDKAIQLSVVANESKCDADVKLEQFNVLKSNPWTCIKWLFASLPCWIWIILTFIFGGSIVIKLLRSGVLKFV
jgi:hypothetical protein